LASQIVTHKRKHNKYIDRVAVDNGQLEISEVPLNLPTKLEDGIYPVYLSADGCKIIIDITPFDGGFDVNGGYRAWKKEVVKMRRDRKKA
jgi:hypothetical protein